MIKVNAKASDFTLKDQSGNEVSLSDYYGKSRVVLYFYPSDMTKGCMLETRTFQKRLDDFENTIVLGISTGTEDSKKEMANTCGATFPLLNDVDGKVRKEYGVKKDFLGLLAGRATYCINEEGIVVKVHSSATNMESHITESLKVFGKVN